MTKKEDDPQPDKFETLLKQPLIERILSDISWILPALVIAYFAELPKALQEHGYGTSLYLSISSFFGFASIGLYLMVWIPYQGGKSVGRSRYVFILDLSNWEKECPRSIKVATLCGGIL
jgi:hypothetical protein